MCVLDLSNLNILPFFLLYRMGSAGDTSPFDFFRQETSNIDPVVRANAMGKATIICALMGADKARNELIPYLKSKFNLTIYLFIAKSHQFYSFDLVLFFLDKVGDLDQVLMVLAQKLGDFVPYIGGPEFAHHLIPALEVLISFYFAFVCCLCLI